MTLENIGARFSTCTAKSEINFSADAPKVSFMLSPNSNGHGMAQPQVSQRRRSPWPLTIVAALFIIVPFLTWYTTWFGRTLSDEEVAKYLSDEKNARHVQHALAQIEEGIEKNNKNVRRYYPRIVELSRSPVTEVRQTTAWVMGQDNQSEEFHAALTAMLDDAQPIVRRNAAVQLTRFNDARGLNELRAILKPYEVAAPFAGQIVSILGLGAAVKEGSLLARIRVGTGELQEFRSALPGKVAEVRAGEGAQVSAGETLVTLAPDENFVFAALVALANFGTQEDLPLIEKYARGAEGMSAQVQKQAALTARAIESRAKQSSGNR